MTQHGIQIPAAHAQDQFDNALPRSDEEVFNLSIQLTSTKQKRRQICVYKQSDCSDGRLSAPSMQAQSVGNDCSTVSPGCKYCQRIEYAELYED
jgi:hypothetical protein